RQQDCQHRIRDASRLSLHFHSKPSLFREPHCKQIACGFRTRSSRCQRYQRPARLEFASCSLLTGAPMNRILTVMTGLACALASTLAVAQVTLYQQEGFRGRTVATNAPVSD